MTGGSDEATSAFVALGNNAFRATPLTRGPWDPRHQHAGPPIALVCGVIERAAAEHGLTHLARLTANLIRPVPIADLSVELTPDYIGRSVGHFSARLVADGKEVARFTAAVHNQTEIDFPAGLPGHPLPQLLPAPDDAPPVHFPFDAKDVGYFKLMAMRLAGGGFFTAPSRTWFRLRYPLIDGETPSAAQRVAVAADSGNGISAVLDLRHWLFMNTDLSLHLLRQPQGEWIALDARTLLGPDGNGVAESALYDTHGLVGRATQSLVVRARG